MIRIRELKIITILELLTGIGLILFWLGFFTIGLAPENPPPCYFAYEHSFPLPDMILAMVLLAAGTQLLKHRESGRILSLIGAGGLIFLGLLDFSFNIQNGVYMTSTVDLVLNIFINLWCIVLGAVIAVFFGRRPVA